MAIKSTFDSRGGKWSRNCTRACSGGICRIGGASRGSLLMFKGVIPLPDLLVTPNRYIAKWGDVPDSATCLTCSNVAPAGIAVSTPTDNGAVAGWAECRRPLLEAIDDVELAAGSPLGATDGVVGGVTAAVGSCLNSDMAFGVARGESEVVGGGMAEGGTMAELDDGTAAKVLAEEYEAAAEPSGLAIMTEGSDFDGDWRLAGARGGPDATGGASSGSWPRGNEAGKSHSMKMHSLPGNRPTGFKQSQDLNLSRHSVFASTSGLTESEHRRQFAPKLNRRISLDKGFNPVPQQAPVLIKQQEQPLLGVEVARAASRETRRAAESSRVTPLLVNEPKALQTGAPTTKSVLILLPPEADDESPSSARIVPRACVSTLPLDSEGYLAADREGTLPPAASPSRDREGFTAIGPRAQPCAPPPIQAFAPQDKARIQFLWSSYIAGDTDPLTARMLACNRSRPRPRPDTPLSPTFPGIEDADDPSDLALLAISWADIDFSLVADLLAEEDDTVEDPLGDNWPCLPASPPTLTLNKQL
ncbi:hypothetical protein BDK51DRAFT_42635 [Blyttiomyces helicus]|uniref:Uncharacterized protein n=1 Tax=Blyttiomyces helicus TaxID=388810 RepID=A0A4P9WCG2_9FUNG|nr:hypothetical protein BDK51DRAFT_42635 [Blyttiomyces helicus]|eukprot:RKO88046.1 hypothetical protein BDK51DRAFT_42635 [Blyttiomyces helicus]